MKFLYAEDQNKRYHSWNYALRQQFGEKIFKVPIDGGFDCPNRDGTVAHGGCTFCSVSGSGDMIVAPEDPLPIQFQKEIDMMHQKWPGVAQYIVYFQNFTNTHAPLAVIKERFEQVVNLPGVVGLSIGTRPDCLPDDVVEYLAELNERLYLDYNLQRDYYASVMGVDRNRFATVIKEATDGGNLSTYLNNMRLNYSVTLFREHPEMSISEVSDASAIPNISTFYRLFKEKYGLSPKMFIEQLKSEG